MAGTISSNSSPTPKPQPARNTATPARSSITASRPGRINTPRVNRPTSPRTSGFAPSRELRESRETSGSKNEQRADSVRAVREAWSVPSESPSSESRDTPLDAASTIFTGADGAQSSMEFKDAAAEAHRTEANRPGRGPSGVDEFLETKEQLRQDGHEVKRSTGKRVNAEHIADKELRSQRRYRVETEIGPDGRSRVKSKGWVPPSADGPAANIRVGEQGLETSRVTNGSNKGVGGFSAPLGSIDGLTREEIQQKLALDEPPTHKSTVRHEPGAHLRQSVVGPQPGHDQGGKQGSQFEHVKRSEASIVPGSETELHDLNVKSSRFAGALDRIGRVFRPLGVATDTKQIANAIRKDGGTVGLHTVREATSVAGGWAGGIVGAQGGATLGAAVGTAVFPFVGSVTGGLVGGLAGGILGSFAGGNLGNRFWQ
jgi:hypothetical protein